MSRPFSEAAATGGARAAPLAAKLLVGALLAAHVAWISTHLWLVAGERINPWKLGGYGMYTVPHPEPQTHLFLFDQAAGGWAEVPRASGRFGSYRFDTAMDLHVFRCRAPDEAALRAFFEENPHLRFRQITLVMTEVRFDRDAGTASRQPYATVQIAWGGRERMGWRGEICGEPFSGEIAWAP